MGFLGTIGFGIVGYGENRCSRCNVFHFILLLSALFFLCQVVCSFFQECLQKLGDKFPGSPRVDVLTGIRMEATEPPNTVLAFYDELLKADSTNIPVWKRRISVLRRLGRIEKAVEELNQLLDIFYTDLEGWLELADIYSFCNQ